MILFTQQSKSELIEWLCVKFLIENDGRGEV